MKDTRILTMVILIALIVVIFISALNNLQNTEKQSNSNSIKEIEVDDKLSKTDLVWETYYGGGFWYDEVIKVTKKDAVRVSTGIDGGWYGARTTFPAVDFSNKAISFSVRVHNWDELQRLTLVLASDDGFEHYYAFNIKNYFAKPASGEWIRVVVEPSYFELVEGGPEWSEITGMALRVIPVEGMSTKVWFDDFAFVNKKLSGPVITMTFDDGFASNIEAARLMRGYGYVGSAYIIPEFIGTENYLNQVDIDELAGFGWDIGGHGKDNLVLLEPSEVDTHLATMYAYLKEKGYKGGEHYVYPNGGYNLSVRSQVLEYFISARTIDGFSQPLTEINRSTVNAYTVSSSTSISEVINYVERAINDRSWLIIVWHDLNDNPMSDVEYRYEDFKFLLEYLSKQEVEVLSYSEAYNRFSDLVR